MRRSSFVGDAGARSRSSPSSAQEQILHRAIDRKPGKQREQVDDRVAEGAHRQQIAILPPEPDGVGDEHAAEPERQGSVDEASKAQGDWNQRHQNEQEGIDQDMVERAAATGDYEAWSPE